MKRGVGQRHGSCTIVQPRCLHDDHKLVNGPVKGPVNGPSSNVMRNGCFDARRGLVAAVSGAAGLGRDGE